MLSLISPKYELCGGLCVRRSRDVLKKRPLMHPLITEHVSPLKSFLYGYITPLFRSNRQKIGFISKVIPLGRGRSKLLGIPKNKECSICNITKE
jgi:hypothetical protein